MVEAALVTNDGKQNVLELLFPNSMNGGSDNPGVRYPYMAVGISTAGYTQGSGIGLGQECQEASYQRVELSASFGSDGTSVQLSGTFDTTNITTVGGAPITEVGIVNTSVASVDDEWFCLSLIPEIQKDNTSSLTVTVNIQVE